MPFKVIQDHHFLYQSTAGRALPCVWIIVTLSYIAPFARYGGLLVKFWLSTGVPQKSLTHSFGEREDCKIWH